MQPTKRRILCAEPHADIHNLLTLLLARTGYELYQAKTIAEAMSAAESRHFDLYLLDDIYEDGTAFDLCERLRQRDPHTPILFFTTYARESDRQRGLGAGAQAYLVKPGDIFELEGAVTGLIEQAESAPRPEERSAGGGGFGLATGGLERRRRRRIYHPFPAVVYGADTAGEELEERTVLDDLSASGLHLRLSRRVEPGAKLSIVVYPSLAPIPGAPPLHVAVNGKVTRAEPLPGGGCELAVMFHEVDFFETWSWALR